VSDNITPLRRPTSFALAGPFEEYEVLVDSRRIPLLTGKKTEDGRFNIIVDKRFMGGPFDERAVEQVTFLLAQAIAIASGYSNYEAQEPGRPFAPIVRHLGEISEPPHSSHKPEAEV
jgi:hypothetical protein